MAVTASWKEYNGGEGSLAAGTDISNTNWGSTNAVNLTALSFPIQQNTRSFFKQQALYVASITASETVQNPLLWRSAGSFTDTDDSLEVADQGNTTIITPTNADITGVVMPTSVGTAFAISGAAISTGGNAFNFFRTQIVVDSATVNGSSGLQLTLRYEIVG